MKATLEFNLPKETEEHQIAVDGQKWRGVVSDALVQLQRAGSVSPQTCSPQ